MTSSRENSCNSPDYQGKEINLKRSNELVAVIPKRFNEFEFCIPWSELNVHYRGEIEEEFELESTSNDGVCITSMTLNKKKMFFGTNNQLSSFWIDGNQKRCSNHTMATSKIKIVNEKIVASECIGK